MKFLKEEDEEKPSGWFAPDYNIEVMPMGASVEETAAAFDDVKNYGMYIANIRSQKVTPKDIDDYFGPAHRPTKMKMEKERGKPFPIRTKDAMNAFIASRAGKPNLVTFEITGDTLLFPKEKNPSKDTTFKIIKTVLDNAGIGHRIKEKESYTENINKLKDLIREEIRKQIKK